MASLKDDNTADSDKNVTIGATSPASTGSPTTYRACHAALDTTELLEAIILCLPAIKVFGVQRVSKKWLDTIASSSSIQQRAFLSALPVTDRWIGRATANLAAGLWDPRYSNHELILAPTGDYERLHYVDGVPKEYFSIAFEPTSACPLVETHENGQGVAVRFIKSLGEDYVTLHVADFMHRKGSWEKMLLTNPPCTLVELDTIVVLETVPQKTIRARLMLVNEDGLTIGEILEHAMATKALSVEVVAEGSFAEGEGTEEYGHRAVSINDLLAGYGSQEGEQVKIKSSKVNVELKMMALATEEERQMVRAGGIKVMDD